MSALPYMPLYVADYLADAAHLSTEEHGAYLLLIMNYWQRGKPLPCDPERLARIARLSNERWTDVERTLNEFFTVVDGEWRHKRIDDELAKVHAKSEKAKQAGRASARSKSATNPTDVQRTLNERSTDVEQTFNHTDTDTEGIILEGRAREIPDPVARETNQFTEDWNRIEAELRKAAGWENEPAPNLAIMGPVIEALRTGVDFELDLLPSARAHGQKMRSKTSWNYIIECAISARDRRRAVRSGAERVSRMGGGDGAGRGTGGGLIEKFLGGQRGGVETGNGLP